MSRLTDTQLIILSSASQRDDRGVDLPANVRAKRPARRSISSSAPAAGGGPRRWLAAGLAPR